MTGPRSKTITDRFGNIIQFKIKNNKVLVIDGGTRIVMHFTDAQTRGLRNWLNCHLDNK